MTDRALRLWLVVTAAAVTRHKEDTLPAWGELAREKGCWLHVGRVNTARRIALCAAASATSFDGSGPSRYAVVLQKLDLARRQPDLLAWRGDSV